jgi:hypothetical protein
MNLGNRPLIESVFAGDGEVATAMRALDWSATPLGPVHRWPQSLRTIVGVVLGAGYPMAIVWGRQDYVLLYNDAYRRVTDVRTPWALGRGVREVFPEVWEFIRPIYDSVMDGGKTITDQSDVMIPLNQDDYLEQFYFAYTASPIPDDNGGVGGVLATLQDTTERVLEYTRRRLLSDLTSRAAGARTEEKVWRVSAETIGEHRGSVPFALLYEYRPSEHRAYLAGASVELDEALRPAVIDCRVENAWRLDPALPKEGVLVELGVALRACRCRAGRPLQRRRARCRSGWENTARRWGS